jgi:ABC-type polar amino acid transport system ATPase subunit
VRHISTVARPSTILKGDYNQFATIFFNNLNEVLNSLTLNGRPLHLRRAREAIHHGITMVMQETSLAPDLSVLENIFLAELGRPGCLSHRGLKRRAEEILARLGQRETLPLDRVVRFLSAAQRQLVEIAKALALNPPRRMSDAGSSNSPESFRGCCSFQTETLSQTATLTCRNASMASYSAIPR